MTRLEWAHNKFRANPSEIYAGLYRRVAIRAWFAREIDDQALLNVLHEVRDHDGGDDANIQVLPFRRR